MEDLFNCTQALDEGSEWTERDNLYKNLLK